MSKATEQIIKGLLQLNPEKRLTATQVREHLKAIIDSHSGIGNTDHMVPEMSMNASANANTNTNDNTYQSTSSETPFKEKWKKVSISNIFVLTQSI